MRKNKKTPFAKSKAAKRFAKNTKRRSSPPTYESLRNSYHETVRIEGLFSATERGFGFVTADKGYNLPADIFIPAKFTKNAISGDRVAIEVKKRELKRNTDSQFHIEGQITEIIERGIKSFCGTLILDARLVGRNFSPYRVIPDNPRLGFEAEIDDIKSIDIGNKVEVKLLDYGSGPRPPKGEIIRDLGKTFSLGANYESVLFEHGIRTEFPIEAK